MRNYVFQTVMSAGTSLSPYTEPAGIKINVIAYNYDVLRFKLIKAGDQSDAFSRKVHKCLRMYQHYLFALDKAFTHKTVKLSVFKLYIIFVRQCGHRIKADVMPCSGVLCARIPEPDYCFHFLSLYNFPTAKLGLDTRRDSDPVEK